MRREQAEQKAGGEEHMPCLYPPPEYVRARLKGYRANTKNKQRSAFLRSYVAHNTRPANLPAAAEAAAEAFFLLVVVAFLAAPRSSSSESDDESPNKSSAVALMVW